MKFFEKKNSDTKLLPWLIGIFILILLGFVAWYFFLYREGDISGVTGVSSTVEHAKPVSVEFGGEVFQSRKFQELKSHGRLPVEAGTRGVVNPFSIPFAEISEETGLEF